MEMSVIAVLLGLSLALILTAKIAETLGMRYITFLRLGVLCCVAAEAPLVDWMIFVAGKGGPDSLFWPALLLLGMAVSDIIDVFRSKGEITPPSARVKRPGQGSVAQAAKKVAFYVFMGFVFYFAVGGSLPFVGRMSGWDMIACGFFAMAGIIRGFQTLFQRVEICGNGLWDSLAIPPKLKPWEAYESFSWAEETKDGVELRLQAELGAREPIRLIVRPEDREVVRKILEANLPDQLSGAHDGLSRRILPPCVPVRRTRRRRLAQRIASVLCWPAVVLLLIYLWNRNVSLEAFSVYGFVLIMITLGFNFAQPQKIEICRNGLLKDHELRGWDQYLCFFWKGETKDGFELRLPSYGINTVTRLVVAPKDRETVQQILEANLQDRTADPGTYSVWPLS
jgi:hypothetical protein